MILNTFRNASQSLVIKILFGAIIFSFCLWGVGDIIRNYTASKTVFSIEKTKVSVDQFLREYSQEKQRIRNIGSKPLSDKEMAQLDIKNIVLTNMMNKAILEEMYRQLNIIVPKRSLIDVIHSIPDFRNKDGQFDERIYQTAIRRSGLNEQGLLLQIKDNLARNQLIHPIISGYKVPKFIKAHVAKEFESVNTLLLAKVDVNSLSYKKEVKDEELKQYYSNNTEKYQVPETREVDVLVIDYQTLGKSIEISDEEVNQYYNENQAAYNPKEKRDFERFAFDSKEDADKAWDMMNRGVSTSEVVKKLIPDMEVVKGVVSSDLPSEMAKSLFSLKLTKTSEVYYVSGKYYIYRLVNISKESAKSEKEIKAQVKEDLRNERMNSPEFYSKIKDMKNKIDDAFGSGKSISDISKETGMKVVSISDLKKDTENSKFNEIIKDEDTRTEVLAEVFTAEEGQVTQIIDSKETDTLSYAVLIKKVHTASTPAFDAIKSRVKSDYILEKKGKDALKKIGDVIDSEKAIADLKKAFSVKKFKFSKKDLIMNGKVSNAEVNRILKEIPNPNAILNIISSLKSGDVTYYRISDTEYLVVGMEKIEKATLSTTGFVDLISAYLDNGAAGDVLPVSLNAFKKNLKIDIDDKLLAEITKQEDERSEDQ